MEGREEGRKRGWKEREAERREGEMEESSQGMKEIERNGGKEKR